MSQEVTVILKVDIAGAFANDTLNGNIYLFDNLRTAGSTDIGTDHLSSMAKGFYWSNGVPASGLLINWLGTAIANPPISVPEKHHVKRAGQAQQSLVDSVHQLLGDKADADAVSAKLTELAGKRVVMPKIKGLDGVVRHHNTPLITSDGEFANEDVDPAHVSDMYPIVTNIRGEAVEKKVLYPAQYGTPIDLNSGWYWSASIDTNLAGRYRYTMDILLHRIEIIDGDYVWIPKIFSHDAWLEVQSEAKRNGFTHGADGVLPIY